jgi:hypothetical protein
VAAIDGACRPLDPRLEIPVQPRHHEGGCRVHENYVSPRASLSIEELPDGMVVRGGRPLKGAHCSSHHDHRLAMMLGIAALVPHRYRDYVYSRTRAVSRLVSAFVRGQITVCLILGSFYAVALTACGVPMGCSENGTTSRT